jgi:hypothetical protein
MSGPHLSGLVLFLSCPKQSGMGRPVRVLFEIGPAGFEFGPFRFYLFPACLELIQIGFGYVFQTLIPRDLQIHF